MIGTIRPVVYRDRQLLWWGIAAQLHVLGAVAGALAVGGLAGLFGSWLLPARGGRWTALFAILGALGLAYALDELRILHLPRPQRTEQVPSAWRRTFHPWVTAFLYGLSLGSGLTTRVATGALYVVLAGLVLAAEPVYAGITFGLFGLARGLSVFAAGWLLRRRQSMEEFHPALQWLSSQQDRMHALAGVALALCGGYWASNVV